MQRSRSEIVVSWVLGLLVVYVLSVGPMFRLCDKGVLSGRVMWIYLPLFEAAHLPGVGGMLFEYIGWWYPKWKHPHS